ncbi:50S ribosomal protein L30 [Thiotrichales bacterium 19S11-10]|nr:50S ribosomal protein L30 [Thiotrichales bacterium 19S11-10]MCF6807618.1 50S ribosomal protein L30 [Thiotrichales bacterium 19S9-11]MCF6811587.1 50S ribosomal protein L30 [Thiotrichales bacterium 19S9-12]
MAEKTIKVTLKRSLIGRLQKHLATAKGLGLKKINQTVEVLDTPENRGMINQIGYMVEVKE